MALLRPAPLCVPAPLADPKPAYKIAVEPHLIWCRMVARVVRAQSGFLASSQEEAELEAVAFATLCKHAIAFDPGRVRPDSTPEQCLRGWSKRDIMTECQRAAEKLKRGGIRLLPAAKNLTPDAAPSEGAPPPPPPPPRCRTCTEVFDAMAWTDGREEEEEPEEVVREVAASEKVSFLPPCTNQYAFALPARADQNARIMAYRRRAE